MRKTSISLSILLAFAFLFTFAVTTQGAIQAPEPTVSEQGVRYLNGGVGLEERRAMENITGFNLKLVFANEKGKYISNVSLTLRDADGNYLVAHKDAGPWLMADLPQGNYRINAVVDGEPIRKRVRVGHQMRTLNLTW